MLVATPFACSQAVEDAAMARLEELEVLGFTSTITKAQGQGEGQGILKQEAEVEVSAT
jgi:hypothetical protein